MSGDDAFELPAAFAVADAVSMRAQRLTKNLVRLELSLALVAGVLGLGRVMVKGHDALALGATAAFVAVLVSTLIRSLKDVESAWYLGRAQAESARTLAWRFAVGGDPFPAGTNEAESEEDFLRRIQEVVDFMADRGLSAPADADSRQLTDSLRSARRSAFEDRRTLYLNGRIDYQIRWYTDKAEAARRRQNLWTVTACTAATIGILAGLARFVDATGTDLLGVMAAAFGAAIAWAQLNQFKTLTSSYAVAQQELILVRDRLLSTPSEKWATFVSDSEDAISREHSMWLARRGHPSLQPRRQQGGSSA
ncbi:MAG: hypothetical protein RJB61_1542 [Actinomycetota bacterium]|jgi:hypothetical protein